LKHHIDIVLTSIEDHCAIDKIVLISQDESTRTDKTIYYNYSQETKDCCDLDYPFSLSLSVPKIKDGISELMLGKDCVTLPYGVIILLKRKKNNEPLSVNDFYIEFLSFNQYWSVMDYSNPKEYLLEIVAEKDKLEEFYNSYPKIMWYRLPLFVSKLEHKVHQIRNMLNERTNRNPVPEKDIRVPDEDLELLISFCERNLSHLRDAKRITERFNVPPFA
jgi:hypothetical protein